MSLNHKYYLQYFKYGLGAVLFIVLLFFVSSLFTSEKEAEYEYKTVSNEKLISSYDSLKDVVVDLQKYVKDQKIDYTNYYNIVSPDSVDLNGFSNKDKYSYWFVFCYDKINYRTSYGIKIKGIFFNEKLISKMVDPDRNKGRGESSMDRGGISFFKRISLEEYNNCENQKEEI